MQIKNLREWLIYKTGDVSGATNRTATIGELMTVVELIIESQEDKK